MERDTYNAFLDILHEELIPAMGCTEPIAVAYAAALARKHLEAFPEKVILTVSRNIIKNVKSVIVPNTNGRKGLKVAIAAGICYGNPDKLLQVIGEKKDGDIEKLDMFLDNESIEIKESDSPYPFDISVSLFNGENKVTVRIVNDHTNVVLIEENGITVFEKTISNESIQIPENRKLLTVERIVQFADELDINDVKDVFQKQIDYNMAIAQAGLQGDYGAQIGKILIHSYGNAIQNRAKAWAAAGSDARMNGCELPVIINSGSGNQGITASVPVIIYAKELGVSDDLLFRALAISNLVTIHLKTGIGSLSAYCGAISAGAGAGAGICYLYGGKFVDIAHTIVNSLAISSGTICDGAKASCAAKIASAVESGILGMQMFMHGSQFFGGDGIVKKGVENTIEAISRIARDGMKSTDSEIIDIMIKDSIDNTEEQ